MHILKNVHILHVISNNHKSIYEYCKKVKYIKLSKENTLYVHIQGVPIKSAATLKQYYSTTKRFAENIKTVLELWGIGL